MKEIDLDKLKRVQLTYNYKELVDKIKIQILESQIKLMDNLGKDNLQYSEIKMMLDGINKMRNKEKDKELEKLSNTIIDLINRYD